MTVVIILICLFLVFVMFQSPSLHLECLANYIAELSLLEYNMLCFVPSLIAASSIFLAKYILLPSNRPWVCSRILLGFLDFSIVFLFFV